MVNSTRLVVIFTNHLSATDFRLPPAGIIIVYIKHVVEPFNHGYKLQMGPLAIKWLNDKYGQVTLRDVGSEAGTFYGSGNMEDLRRLERDERVRIEGGDLLRFGEDSSELYRWGIFLA